MSLTLSGFSMTEVLKEYKNAIQQSAATQVQRWSAELICSPGGYQKWELQCVHLWAMRVSTLSPSWIRYFAQRQSELSDLYSKGQGSVKAFRNNGAVRNLVAEVSESLRQCPQRPPMNIPTRNEVLKQAASLRDSIRGSAVAEHPVLRKTWRTGYDSEDLRILGNECLHAIENNQLTRALFFLLWLLELEPERVALKINALKRAPIDIPENQRASISWYCEQLLRNFARQQGDQSLLYVATGTLLDLYTAGWRVFSSLQKRDLLVAAAQICCERHLLQAKPVVPDRDSLQRILSNLDNVYSRIAQDAKAFEEQKSVKQENGEEKGENEKQNQGKKGKLSTAEKLEAIDETMLKIMGL